MPLGPMKTKAQKREGMHTVMHEFKHGALRSGSKTGPVVKNRKQAIAIALSQTGQSKYAEGGAAKETKTEVHYRAGLGHRRCGNCTMFRAPEGCTAVEGKIRAADVCDLFKLRTRQYGGSVVDEMKRIADRRKKDFGYALGGSLPKLPMKFPRYGAGFTGAGLRGFKHLQAGGFIDSDVPGRTDKHYVTVDSGSYVLPADHVSALGQNNSNAGADVVRKMFGPGTKFGPRLAIPRFAGGGSVEPVPIVVAGGEIVVPPNVVRRIGNGDIGKGHEVLDRWVLATRKKHIDKLKSLKPPKGSDEK